MNVRSLLCGSVDSTAVPSKLYIRKATICITLVSFLDIVNDCLGSMMFYLKNMVHSLSVSSPNASTFL